METWIVTHNNHAGGRRSLCVQVSECGPGPLICDEVLNRGVADRLASVPQLEAKLAMATDALDALYHQLSTDSDLETVSNPIAYENLRKLTRDTLEAIDPGNPQLTPVHVVSVPLRSGVCHE